MAEVLEFRVPSGPGRTLLVLGLETDATEVCLCTRQRSFLQQNLALNSSKCQELANHYLGFNGWSSRIVTLQDISGFEGEENDEEDARGSTGSQRCKYLCVRELTIPQHGICVRGLGVAEVPVDPGEGFLTAMRSAQKLAVLKALSEAFQKILLVVLENGKVAVEYVSSQEDLVDCLAEEELKGLLQVTDLPFLQLNPDGEEEILSDFSMEGD
ncbi:RAD52 motif-containing protein 1 isoform X2 [Paroedura picta]|uniref:RAD52 motif-containing protein 1 isoform X2 n=1 Tax=Paroedura picta TaxID=143630 RepID=UPI004056280A